MPTTPIFNIAQDAVATFAAYQWVLSDKVDDGAEVPESELTASIGAVWGNAVSAAMRQINEVFQGSRVLDALRVGGSSGTASTNADELIIGGTEIADAGFTVYCSDNGRLLFANSTGNARGGLHYNETNKRLTVIAGGNNVLRVNDDGGSNRYVAPETTNVYSLGISGLVWSQIWGTNGRFVTEIRLNSATGPLWTSGTGSPEGVVTAPVSSMYSRTDGGAGTSLYVKESGSGNTGWVGK